MANMGFSCSFFYSTLCAVFVACNGAIPIPKACTGCTYEDTVCICDLEISYGLSSMLGHDLVRPFNGGLQFPNQTKLTHEQSSKVIPTDGVLPELIITINGQFPGPNIVAYEGQDVTVTVVNRMHTDSTTIHWHGIHQRGTPIMDGVSMVSQCPIAAGQTFVYKFKAFPHGTNFYHAHIGDQRSMGLYGGFVIKQKKEIHEVDDEFVILLQDWNHDLDPETAYYTMITDQYDLKTGKKIPTSTSQDGANFSKFNFQSGLANGKGRFYNTSVLNNGSPLEIFNVTSGKRYRFRVISAATLYPFQVRIDMHKLQMIASDGFYFEPVIVDAFVIQPGERFDFILQALPPDPGKQQYMFVAETLEIQLRNKYHAAEAIINYRHSGHINLDPPRAREPRCGQLAPCMVFNCPFPTFPKDSGKFCINFNNIKNNDTLADEQTIMGVPAKEIFLNFAFPGPKGRTPGSVNGHQFELPSVPILTEFDRIGTKCNPQKCTPDSICSCSYLEELQHGDLVQLVLTNVGKGSGWSHPVHIHGHALYIMEVGFGSFNSTSGKITGDNNQIVCPDPSQFCNDARWKNETRTNDYEEYHGYPQKDTIIVPTGGYVVARFRADNPGAWFLHCHIDLHNTNGMAMVLMEGKDKVPPMPDRFPICWGPEHDTNRNKSNEHGCTGYIIALSVICVVVVIGIIAVCLYYRRSVKPRMYENMDKTEISF